MKPTEHIRTFHDEFTAIRRDLHAHPELGFEEHRTARVVQEKLAALGIEHHTGIGRTGLVAVIPGRTNASGKAIVLFLNGTAKAVDYAKLKQKVPGPGGTGYDFYTYKLLPTD